MSTHYIKQENDLFDTELVGSGVGPPFYSYEGNAVYGTLFNKSYSRVSPNGFGGREYWHAFEHHKVLCVRSQYPTGCQVARKTMFDNIVTDTIYNPLAFMSSVYGDAGFFNKNLPAFVNNSQAESGFISDPTSYQDLKSEGLKTLCNLIQAKMSSINSFYELKDIPSLIESARGLRRISRMISHPQEGATLYQLLRSLNKKKLVAFVKATAHTSREAFRVAADVYLQKMFNIGPLISDIGTIHSSLSRLEKRMRRFLNTSSQPNTYHFDRVWQENTDTVETANPIDTSTADPLTWTNFRSVNKVTWTRQCLNAPTKFHAEIEAAFTWRQYQIEHARLYSLLDDLGVNFNPRIIWNAVRWSFVVDWVFQVGKFLDGLHIGLMDPMINIYRYCDSVSRKRSIYLTREISVPVDGVWGGGSRVSAPVVTETSYKRSTSLPTLASLQTSGLSSTELSLGAALGLTHRRRP